MDTDRGRSDDWSDFYGAATVTLNNRARRFDPFNTSGPYYGKLLPRRQIKISAVYGATTYPVFRGFVNGWPPVWTDAGQDSTVTLSCMDAMGLLASDSLPADWSRNYILSTSPRHYWPCDEPIIPYVPTTLNDLGSYPLPMTTSTFATSGTQLAVGLVNSSVQGTGERAAFAQQGVPQGVGNFSVSMWALFDDQTPYTTGGIIFNCVFYIRFEPATSTYLIRIDDFNSLLVRQYRTTATFDNGVARLFGFSFNGTSKALVFYIDGVQQAITTLTPVFTPAFSVNEGYNLGAGQTQQFIVWDSVQPQSTFQDVYRYSTVAFSETTAARFNRLIGETPFPSAMTSPPSAPASTVLELTDDAPGTTSELQKVADSEYAPLFVDRSGVLTLYNQNQIRSQTRSLVSQGTYGTGGSSIGQNVAISYDGDSMRNIANVSMSQGGVFIKQNSASVTAYGAAEASVDTQVALYPNAQQVGNIVSGWGGQVYPKADPVEVVLSPSADWSNALDRELNDRITLVVSPPTGNAITTPMLLSSIRHSVVPGEWHTTFEGSARWAAVFILNQSRLNGTDLLG
jgi:hypothetical protein